MNVDDASTQRWRELLRADRSDGRNCAILYVITPPELRPASYYDRFVRDVARGGADIVQFRVKPVHTEQDDSWAAQCLEAATAFVEAAREVGIMSVLNDDPELAVEAGADAVHVGEGDADIETCTAMRGGTLVVGATARTPESIHRAAQFGAAYVGCGPVSDARATKKNAATPIGTSGLRRLCEAAAGAKLPVIAIGGITPVTAGACVAAGARGVAVVRAIADAEDRAAAARKLRNIIDEAADIGNVGGRQ